MGQRNSKTRINVCANPPCFPYFSDEKHMLQVCNKAAKSLSRFRQIITLVSGLVLDTSQMTTVTLCLSATAALIHFAIQRLSKDQPSANLLYDDDFDPESSLTLEDMLLEIKIDKCIVKSAVLCLKAKLTAISNRYDRLIQQDLSQEERRLEVVPALALCEEILELFRDPENVFAKNVIVCTPFLVTFGGVYIAVAELTLAILPSYRSFLVKQMSLLKDVLNYYKNSCIQQRDGVLFLPERKEIKLPESWMDGVCQPLEALDPVNELYLKDPFIPGYQGQVRSDTNSNSNSPGSDSTLCAESEEEFLQFDTREEAASAYKLRLEEKYNMFFSGILSNVADFSGFSKESENCKSPNCPGRASTTTKRIDYYENL